MKLLPATFFAAIIHGSCDPATTFCCNNRRLLLLLKISFATSILHEAVATARDDVFLLQLCAFLLLPSTVFADSILFHDGKMQK